MICSSKLNAFSNIFGIDFQVRNSDVLGKVLGSILASISDHVGVQNDVRTASKNHHEKRCQHKPNMSPNMTPRGLPKRPHESASRWRRGPGFASWPLLCLTSRPEPHLGTMLDNFWSILVNFWTKLVIIFKLIKLDLGQSGTWWTSACQRLCPSTYPFWCPSTLQLQG